MKWFTLLLAMSLTFFVIELPTVIDEPDPTGLSDIPRPATQ